MTLRFLAVTLLAASLSPAADTNAFYAPIRNNDLNAVRNLIRNPGVKTRDERGNSPLLYAASLGSAEAMRLLLDAGADPNAANEFGATPLMWCAGHAVKVRMLLDKGAKVNVRSKLGRTPLEIAAAYDGPIDAAKLLIDKGADVNAADEGGGTVLEQAAGANNLELVKLLIAKGAKVNAVDKAGFTALLGAAGNGNRNGALVKLLLEHGAAVNVKSGETVETVKNGPLALGRITPLHAAAQMNSFEAVEALVKAGADVHAKDVRNADPLVWAVATDRVDPKIVQLLLAKGADKAAAAEWAKRNQDPAVLPLFGLKPAVLPVAAKASSARPVSEAVAKALVNSQQVSAKFMMTGGCVSCHSQNFNSMAVAAAKGAGMKVDSALDTAETRTTVTFLKIYEEQLFQVQDPASGVEGVGIALLQLAAAGSPSSRQTDSMVHHIAAMQRKEGDWLWFEGRPPIEGSQFGQTARAIRAMRVYGMPSRKAEFEERIGRAVAWLQKSEPVTTEDRTMQLLGLKWAGLTAPTQRMQTLVSKQHADGGWGQKDQLASDAYATGEVLWTLHENGMAASDPTYKKGVDFLLRTQQQDGTWHVATRAFGFQPYFQSGFPYDHDQWISQAGTAMAVLGLAGAGK